MANEAPVAEPTLLNEPKKDVPAGDTPESKLFPEPKADEPKAPEPKATEPEPKKDEPKPEPSKPSAEPKATVDYENLKLPEGSLLSAAELEAVKAEAKTQGLSAEEVQGVLEVKNDAVKAFQTRQNEGFAKARQDWKLAWQNDPEYGGDKLRESTELAKRAWDKLADNELKTLADQAGFGDHPAVLRMMARIGKMFSEDQLVRGNLGGAPKEKSAEERLYGKTTPAADTPMS